MCSAYVVLLNRIALLFLVTHFVEYPVSARAPEVTLQSLAAAGRLGDLRWPDFSDYRLAVQRFYERANYLPVWVREGSPTPQALATTVLLSGADLKGLDPEDYDGSRWAARLVRLARTPKNEAETVRFDIALTVSAMRYASDLRMGRVKPSAARFEVTVENVKFESAEFLRDVIDSSDPRKAFANIEPVFQGYLRLENALERYLKLAKEESQGPLPSTKKPVLPGERYAGCVRLAHLLRQLGDLGAESQPTSDVYDSYLVDAVMRFQARHGLESDGRITSATLQQLNTPLDRRVRQIQLTLERWRWAPRKFAHPPIVVNIPEFRLRAFDESYETELEMNVVVGRAYQTQTPVFSSDLRFVTFRPYWNVPRSIERNELIPLIERNRSYLSENRYQLLDSNGEVIRADTVSDHALEQLRSGMLRIRQMPGPRNALGLVAFMFPNEYSVYMHDTPAPELFAKARRDFSHGCIRVQEPENLAVWILKDKPGWTHERVRGAMDGTTTFQEFLNIPIPVLVVYGTAVATEAGEVRFLADIYGHDALLERVLSKRHAR